MKKKPVKKRRKKALAASRGLSCAEVTPERRPAEVERLLAQIAADGGRPLSAYRDPLGGHWHILAALPLDRVERTAFQRDLSDAHVKRLAEKIDRLDRFLDPITAVRDDDGKYLIPNGHHRASAMKRLGARSITALVVTEADLAYQILALNTEKAYNVREKSLEAIRLARELGRLSPSDLEERYAAEFEEPPFLTLGACYEKKGNFSGGAYQPVLRRCDGFLDEKLPKAVTVREKMAARLLALDVRVAATVDALKEKGLKSPYLKAFVLARINPLRFRQSKELADFDETMEKMEASLKKMDPAKIEQRHLAGIGGPPPEEL